MQCLPIVMVRDAHIADGRVVGVLHGNGQRVDAVGCGYAAMVGYGLFAVVCMLLDCAVEID